MKTLSNILFGAFIGMLLGIFFGFVFDSFYTKKSEKANKAKMQMVLFGAIGLIVGGKISSVLEEEKKSNLEKIEQLKKITFTINCKYCNLDFQHIMLVEEDVKFCPSCLSKITYEFMIKYNEIDKLMDGINDLKRNSAKINRLQKMRTIVLELFKYEEYDFPIEYKKPSKLVAEIESQITLLNT